jgi:hypothetical protein
MPARLERPLSLNSHFVGAMLIATLLACSAVPSQKGKVEPDDTQPRLSSPKTDAYDHRQTFVLATYKSNGLSMSARTQGILRRQDSCLLIDHGDGQSSDVLVFPEGRARWMDAENTLVYKGVSTKIGDEIDLAGGSVDLNANAITISNLPKDCTAKVVWLVG